MGTPMPSPGTPGAVPYPDDVRSENRGLLDYSRRKRSVEFHKEDYKRPRAFFYCAVVVCVMFLAGVFVVKNQEISWLQGKLNESIIDSQWRN